MNTLMHAIPEIKEEWHASKSSAKVNKLVPQNKHQVMVKSWELPCLPRVNSSMHADPGIKAALVDVTRVFFRTCSSLPSLIRECKGTHSLSTPPQAPAQPVVQNPSPYYVAWSRLEMKLPFFGSEEKILPYWYELLINVVAISKKNFQVR